MFRLKAFLWLTALLCMPSAWANNSPPASPTITLYVTVDWEGWSLDEENLEAMRQFRQKHPGIPMLHLLNPVYFVRADMDANAAAQKIKSTLLPADGHGLHLHGWKSLVERCELPYQGTPSFSGPAEECNEGDCGYTVSLEYAYSEHELTILVGCSVDLLVQQGFEWPKSFRAGGWQFGPKLANAIQRNGFLLDTSRTAPHLVAKRWDESSNLVKMVRALHADGDILDQPYELMPGLMEYPNNGSLVDYTRTEELVEIFRTLVANNKHVMVLGFHQESAFNYLDRLSDAIPLMQQIANEAGVQLQWAQYR
jgi:hypothetical protein